MNSEGLIQRAMHMVQSASASLVARTTGLLLVAVITLSGCGGGSGGGSTTDGGATDTTARCGETTSARSTTSICATFPALGGSQVAVSGAIYLKFSASTDPLMVEQSDIVVQDSLGQSVAGSVAASGARKDILFRPDLPLSYGERYTATLYMPASTAVRSLVAVYSWSFDTASSAAAPAIAAHQPASGAVDVGVDTVPIWCSSTAPWTRPASRCRSSSKA